MINDIIKMLTEFELGSTSQEIQTMAKTLEGMSGHGNMQILNNAVRLMDSSSVYMEVGTWKGKTLISAALDNSNLCTGIDNFSQFGESESLKRGLQEQLDRYAGRLNVRMIEGDYREVLGSLPIQKNVEVYLYDGHHAEEHQYEGIKRAIPHLTDEAIIFVDDSAGGSRKDVFAAHDRLLRDGYNLSIVRHFESPEGEQGYWQGLLAVKYVR
jgi:hypothetical protein